MELPSKYVDTQRVRQSSFEEELFNGPRTLMY